MGQLKKTFDQIKRSKNKGPPHHARKEGGDEGRKTEGTKAGRKDARADDEVPAGGHQPKHKGKVCFFIAIGLKLKLCFQTPFLISFLAFACSATEVVS